MVLVGSEAVEVLPTLRTWLCRSTAAVTDNSGGLRSFAAAVPLVALQSQQAQVLDGAPPPEHFSHRGTDTSWEPATAKNAPQHKG